MPRSIATSSAARSTPVWPPLIIFIVRHDQTTVICGRQEPSEVDKTIGTHIFTVTDYANDGAEVAGASYPCLEATKRATGVGRAHEPEVAIAMPGRIRRTWAGPKLR